GGALRGLGVKPSDRVATLSWANHQHLEAYLAIPSIGAVLHTLNLRLHQDDLSYIVTDASDRVVLLDESLLELWEKVRAHVKGEQLVIPARCTAGPVPKGYLDYEELLAAADPSGFVPHEGDERDAA